MADLRPMFRKWHKQRNKEHPTHLLPILLKIEQGDNEWIVELSEGKRFEHIWGVSVFHHEGKGKFTILKDRGKSKIFRSRKEAEQYFDKIVEEF